MAHTQDAHELIRQQLQDMSRDDMKASLLADPLVRAVLNAVPPADRAKIESFVVDFLDGWKRGAVDPIIAMASNPEFVRALMQVTVERDPNNGLGGIV